MAEVKLNKLQALLRTKGVSAPIVRHVECLGEDVHFKRLSARQAMDYQFGMLGADGKVDPKKLKGATTKLVVMCVCDADGLPQLTEDDLALIDNNVLAELFKIANELNNFGNKAVEEAGND